MVDLNKLKQPGFLKVSRTRKKFVVLLFNCWLHWSSQGDQIQCQKIPKKNDCENGAPKKPNFSCPIDCMFFFSAPAVTAFCDLLAGSMWILWHTSCSVPHAVAGLSVLYSGHFFLWVVRKIILLAHPLHRYEIPTEILLKMKLFRPKPATP